MPPGTASTGATILEDYLNGKGDALRADRSLAAGPVKAPAS